MASREKDDRSRGQGERYRQRSGGGRRPDEDDYPQEPREEGSVYEDSGYPQEQIFRQNERQEETRPPAGYGYESAGRPSRGQREGEHSGGYRREGYGQSDYGQESAYRQREEQQSYAQAGFGQGGYIRRDYGKGAGSERSSREGHEQGGYSQGVPGQGGGYSQGGFEPGYAGRGAGGAAIGGAGIGGYVEGAFGPPAGFGQGYGQFSYGQSGQDYRPATYSQGAGAQETRGRGFRGRGPRGYQRSDERINEDVCEFLTEDDDIDATDIQVEVALGEVTLNGTVPDREMKRRAEDLAERVSGVQHVQNNLRVNRGGGRGQAHSDTEQTRAGGAGAKTRGTQTAARKK